MEEAFSEHGNVAETTIIEGKGFGFIEMDRDGSAERARGGANGVELDGRPLRVE